MRAKSLRSTVICSAVTLNDLNMNQEEIVKIDDIITTYMLKTCLFFLYKKHRHNPLVMVSNELKWAEMIYRKLRRRVKRRKLPTYYGDGVLFQCGDHTDDEKVDRVCCQNRALTFYACVTSS